MGVDWAAVIVIAFLALLVMMVVAAILVDVWEEHKHDPDDTVDTDNTE